MNIISWLNLKIKSQFIKLNKIILFSKLNRFKKGFKKCGQNVYIQFPVCFEGIEYITIGDNVSINAFVHMWGHGTITIGNDCLVASHVSITSLSHNPNAKLYSETNIAKEVSIGNNVWIGTHAVILPGVKIGDNSIVAAGALVNKNVPSNVTVAGVPAKIIKTKL